MKFKNRFLLIVTTCYLSLNSFSQVNRDTSINIYFESNVYKLDSDQIRTLINFSSAFNVTSIRGYADSTGTPHYNLSLSNKRAFSVYNVVSNGNQLLNKNMVIHMGESIEEPELWKNRRVHIIASPHPVTEVNNRTRIDTPTIVRSFDLEYVYFIPDQAIVTQESINYINKIAEILKTYKTETFEIIGHINYQSRFDSTHLTDIYQLSERRAKSIYDYLVEFGISPDRMTTKGVGNSQPVIPSPANDDERRKNMRVQIIIRK